MIARQRFNLNRANRLAKHKPTDKTIAEDPLKIAGFEETLVGLTREFTEGVEGIVGQRIEPLHAAEESMLAAIAALDHGQNERAPAHMGDALRHLIEARDYAPDPHRSKMPRPARRVRNSTACRPRRSASPRKTRKRPKRSPSESSNWPRKKTSSMRRSGRIDGANRRRARRDEEAEAERRKRMQRRKTEPDEKKEEAKKDRRARRDQKGPKGEGRGKAGERQGRRERRAGR